MHTLGHLLFGKKYHSHSNDIKKENSHIIDMESIALHMLGDGLTTVGLLLTNTILKVLY